MTRAWPQDLLDWTDPHGYHRNMAILQSSPAAVRMVLQQPRTSHKPSRTHFSDISPLVAATLAGPSSVGARRVMFQNHRYAIHLPGLRLMPLCWTP